MIKSNFKQTLNIISNKCLFVVILLLLLFFVNESFAAADEEFRAHCDISIFNKKYDNGNCWSCGIIYSLLNAFLEVSKILYNSMKEISTLVLKLGGAIWIAVFFLKSLGSIAAQDPMKIMDGLFMFMFKWAFVYAIIISGIDEIVGMIISPILSVGFDIGTTFTSAVK